MSCWSTTLKIITLKLKKKIKEIKCIACEHSVKSDSELTKHYEDKHITNSQKKEKVAKPNKNIK